MPRKHKGDDNVIDFPTTGNDDPSECSSECQECPQGCPSEQKQQVEQGIPVVLQKIDKNRTAGMNKLEDKCTAFEHRDMVTEEVPVNENSIRDIEGAIKAIHLALESMNSLLDMLRYDVIQAIRNIDAGGASTWQLSAHLQTLLDLLKSQGVITEEDLRAKWNELVPKMTKALQEQAAEEDN